MDRMLDLTAQAGCGNRPCVHRVGYLGLVAGLMPFPPTITLP